MSDLISKQVAIDIEGLDEEIRCEMCRNPMHTNRGCDGNCTYDEKLYEKIMQILDRRIKHVPSTQQEPCEDVKFWRKRAEYYSKMCFDLIADINKGVKIDSIEINKDGIKFTKKQTESCDDTVSRQAAIDVMINSRSNADVTLVPGSYTNGWRDGRKLLLDELLQVVFELPSVKPEIIHCEECHWHNDCRYEQYLGLDGFCSRAERRTDE